MTPPLEFWSDHEERLQKTIAEQKAEIKSLKASEPNGQPIDKFQAVEIVRRIVASDVSPEFILVFDVSVKDGKFWVGVEYGRDRNEKGEVVGFTYDSGQIYVVSDRGKVLRIGGMAGWRTPADVGTPAPREPQR
jgi:hypothetical protein